MKEFRRVPMKQLVRRLGVSEFECEAPWQDLEVDPEMVVLPLKQHAGNPAAPVLESGETVVKGQLIARVEDGKLGASVHASISGRLTVLDEAIRIEKG
jgi:Na+-translocating ferredoxin:NAD+ oxidoreductase RnfC subunit